MNADKSILKNPLADRYYRKVFGNPEVGFRLFLIAVRRTLLQVDYKDYFLCPIKFFYIQLNTGETVGLDGKVLKG
ncbi:MAG: hypothetical protein ICV54_04080 [Nostoc sp. C3-bin3]|nr:hypothetical protein [Nostoc sp. C3-bin3]